MADTSHERARAILSRGDALVTTDHIIVETWSLLRRRIGRAAAEGFWDGVRAGAVALEYVAGADLEVAWAIGSDFPDQDFSIVDRTSFAVMQRLGLTRVATFYAHFAVFRYGRRRERAFELVSE